MPICVLVVSFAATVILIHVMEVVIVRVMISPCSSLLSACSVLSTFSGTHRAMMGFLVDVLGSTSPHSLLHPLADFWLIHCWVCTSWTPWSSVPRLSGLTLMREFVVVWALRAFGSSSLNSLIQFWLAAASCWKPILVCCWLLEPFW